MRHIKVTTYGDVREYGKWYPNTRIFYSSPMMWWRCRRTILHVQIYMLFLTVYVCGCKIAVIKKNSNPNIFPKFRIFELLLWRFGGEYNG